MVRDQYCARQHKLTEVACYRPERNTDGGTSELPLWGGGHPISVVELTKGVRGCHVLSDSCACERAIVIDNFDIFAKT